MFIIKMLEKMSSNWNEFSKTGIESAFCIVSAMQLSYFQSLINPCLI